MLFLCGAQINRHGAVSNYQTLFLLGKSMTTNKTWTVTLEEDPETGDVILPFTNEMLEEVGWKEGDVLEWIDNKNGSWSLVKKEEKKSK